MLGRMKIKKTCVAQNISDTILGSIVSFNSRFTSKVCGPYVVTRLDWTPTFGWHMARFAVNNLAPKIYVLLCAQNILDTILGSIVNITIWRAYVTT